MATGLSNVVSRVVVGPILPVYPATPTPDLPVQIGSNFQVEKMTFVDGSEQRVLETDESIKVFKLRYKYLSELNRNTIYNFFIARKGSLEPFYWVNPINQDFYIVRFEEDSMELENFQYKLYNLNEVNLKETHWDF